MSTIVLEGVGRSYAGVAAVRDVSFAVEPGECLVLVGGSGSGKSTTLRMINRLVEPDTGRILFEGEDVRALDAPVLRRRIGYVIQQAGLFPHWSVGRNVATVPALLGWDRARIARRVDELLALLGLPPDRFRDRSTRELSGGQAQRVGIARALAADPPVLLMDEPFSALDPATRRLLQSELVRLRAATGKTIVFVTHDIDEAVTLGTRIAVMRDGALVQLTTPADLLGHPADAGVRDLLGGERAGERLLDAVRVAQRARPGAAPAAADAIAPDATLRDALARMIASGATVLAVEGDAPRHLAIADLVRPDAT